MSTEAATPGLIELGGKQFIVHPPSLAQLKMLAKWARKQAARPNALAELASELVGMDDKSRKIILEAATTSRMNGFVSQEAVEDALLSREGVAQIFSACARKAQPDLTYEQVLELITDENAVHVLESLNEAVGDITPVT